MDSGSLIRLKNRFINLRDNITNVTNTIDKSVPHIEKYNKILSENFIINDEVADIGKGKSIEHNIIDTLHTLKSAVLPAINAQITSLDQQIRIAQERERAAREAAERAAREAQSRYIASTRRTMR